MSDYGYKLNYFQNLIWIDTNPNIQNEAANLVFLFGDQL